MIPVVPAPEPSTFQASVRSKGLSFLSVTPNPTPEQWNRASYWRVALADLRQAYDSVCAYTCFRIPPASRDASVDHFTPKSSNPQLAYEWLNFRFASRRANEWKSTNTIVDPFHLHKDACFINFRTLHVIANPALSSQDYDKVMRSIAVLHLNDSVYVETRQEWLDELTAGQITWNFLCRQAPFLAYELKRQGFV